MTTSKPFSEMLSHTSTEWAPWYVIPADRKWFGRIGAGAVLVNTLMEIDPQFPVVTQERRQSLLEIKETLEAQAPRGAAPDPFRQEQQDSADGKGKAADEQLTEPTGANTGEDGADPLPVS